MPVALALLALAAVALVWWRPWEQLGAGRAPGALRPYNPPQVDLSGLPKGGVLLVHPETGRLYVVRTRPVGTPAAGDEVLTLRELRYQSGRPTLDTSNTFRLDPGRGRLTGPTGQIYPVTVDGGSGVIEIQQAGRLRVVTQPGGLSVLIDGFAAGFSPVSVRLRAGRHQVQVRERGGRRRVLYDEPVEVPARTSITLTLPPAPTGAGTGQAVR